jgi:hypothetical protein
VSYYQQVSSKIVDGGKTYKASWEHDSTDHHWDEAFFRHNVAYLLHDSLGTGFRDPGDSQAA